MKRWIRVPLVFVLISLAAFMLWPIEKTVVADCADLNTCDTAPKTIPGGGLLYMFKVGDAQEGYVRGDLVTYFYGNESKDLYAFKYVPATATAILIGCAVAGVTLVLTRPKNTK